MADDLGKDIKSLRVDGGASANDFLLQFQADIMDCDVYRPVCIETTSLGAAYLAGLATGFWSSKDDIDDNWQIDRIFRQHMEDERRETLLKGWSEAVQRTMTRN